MFENFTLSIVDLGEVTIRVRHGGYGPPLLLLHGHPQTHMMWQAIVGGHFFAEETPEESYAALHAFFTS